MHKASKSTQSVFSVLALFAIGMAASCSDDSEPGGGAGGTSGSAGKGGSAGSSAGTAGTGTAGSNATGGKGGTGGTPGTGGTAGTAGTGNAGSGGDGGVPGAGGAPNETCELPFPVGGAGGQGGEGGGSGGDGAEALEPAILNTYTFDAPGSISGWGISLPGSPTGGVGDSFISRSVDEGDSCAGALRFTVPFTEYGAGANASAQAHLNGADWTGRTKVHLSIKLEDPGISLDYLEGAQVYVQSNGWANYKGQWVATSTLADFAWHEVTVDLLADTPVTLDNVQAVGLQLLAKGAAPEGGPAAPVTTVAYVDDVWLE